MTDNDEQAPAATASKKPDNRITDEVAQEELERFFEEMDLDTDRSGMDDEDRAGFDQACRTMKRAMQKGKLHINDRGEPVLRPDSVSPDGGEITFHEPDGAAYKEMDQRKKGHDIAKMVAVMAAITKQPPKTFYDMKQRDYKVANAVVMLFLG